MRRRKAGSSDEEEEQEVDFSKMTKRQRMAYMQQGATSMTEVGRHNKDTVLD